MKHASKADSSHPPRLSPLSVAALVSVAVLSTACVRSSSHDHGPPTYSESEVNDDAWTANDFGVLRPGDSFNIEGHISDLPFADPYDGFRFTAGEPVHVEFRLFAHSGFADLDVCIFDPQLWIEVDCFATDADPEVGAVDVFAGGLDFHLVVESFVGSSNYTLEIDVYRLGTFAASEDSGDGPAGSIRAVNAPTLASVTADESEDARPAAFGGYFGERVNEPDDEPQILDRAFLFELDGETGELTGTMVLTTTDGLRFEPLEH